MEVVAEGPPLRNLVNSEFQILRLVRAQVEPSSLQLLGFFHMVCGFLMLCKDFLDVVQDSFRRYLIKPS